MLKDSRKKEKSASNVFDISNKFKEAVKIRMVESGDKNELKKFKKLINDLKIVTLAVIQQKETEMLSKLSTGYSYAISFNGNNVIADNTVLAGIKKKLK